MIQRRNEWLVRGAEVDEMPEPDLTSSGKPTLVDIVLFCFFSWLVFKPTPPPMTCNHSFVSYLCIWQFLLIFYRHAHCALSLSLTLYPFFSWLANENHARNPFSFLEFVSSQYLKVGSRDESYIKSWQLFLGSRSRLGNSLILNTDPKKEIFLRIYPAEKFVNSKWC